MYLFDNISNERSNRDDDGIKVTAGRVNGINIFPKVIRNDEFQKIRNSIVLYWGTPKPGLAAKLKKKRVLFLRATQRIMYFVILYAYGVPLITVFNDNANTKYFGRLFQFNSDFFHYVHGVHTITAHDYENIRFLTFLF